MPGETVKALGWFFRNPRTGEFVVAQMPNPPLWVFLAATVATRVFDPDGVARGGFSIVARVSLLVWAALEFTRGDSPFRRVLGAVIGVLTAIAVLGSLPR